MDDILDNLPDEFKEWEREAYSEFTKITWALPRKQLNVTAREVGRVIMDAYADGKSPKETAYEVAVFAGIIDQVN